MVKACVRNQTCAVLTPVNFRDSLVADGTVCGRTQAQSLLGAMRRKMAIFKVGNSVCRVQNFFRGQRWRALLMNT